MNIFWKKKYFRIDKSKNWKILGNFKEKKRNYSVFGLYINKRLLIKKNSNRKYLSYFDGQSPLKIKFGCASRLWVPLRLKDLSLSVEKWGKWGWEKTVYIITVTSSWNKIENRMRIRPGFIFSSHFTIYDPRRLTNWYFIK